MLARAERPVILAGGGVIWSGAEAELVKLAELLQIPVATSLNAKAALPDDHPLNVGVPGTYSRWCANRVLSEADLVFFVGSHAGGQVTTNWQVPEARSRGDPARHRPRGARPQLSRCRRRCSATPRSPCRSSSPRRARAGAATAEWLGRAQSLVREYREESDRAMRSSDAVPIRPERICKEISEWLPEGGVVLSDTGHSGMWTGQMIRLNTARSALPPLRGLPGLGLPGHARAPSARCPTGR